MSEPHTSEQCGSCNVRPYVLVLVLITPKSLPALILRVLASFVNSKTVHKLTTQRLQYRSAFQSFNLIDWVRVY